MSYTDRWDLEGWDVEQAWQDAEAARGERLAAPCECRACICHPDPRQTARYHVQGAALCARCYIGGHLSRRAT